MSQVDMCLKLFPWTELLKFFKLKILQNVRGLETFIKKFKNEKINILTEKSIIPF